MMQTFKKNLDELFKRFSERKTMVLSTSKQDRVTARSVSVIIHDQKFYLQTDSNSLKYEQLTDNPHVALTFENMQIEGLAKDIGKPDEHAFFVEKYQKYFPDRFARYSSLEVERLVEVEPTHISLWQYEDGEPVQVFFRVGDMFVESRPYRAK